MKKGFRVLNETYNIDSDLSRLSPGCWLIYDAAAVRLGCNIIEKKRIINNMTIQQICVNISFDGQVSVSN